MLRLLGACLLVLFCLNLGPQVFDFFPFVNRITPGELGDMHSNIKNFSPYFSCAIWDTLMEEMVPRRPINVVLVVRNETHIATRR